ncbi:MAG: glycosyltransferase family 2 protein [Desulfobacteraceae bacterium]|jgi:GT2 family glycosyltransferase|nr:glycosyltransferase family 2 protein [Desulfobacteraceae bacterium]
MKISVVMVNYKTQKMARGLIQQLEAMPIVTRIIAVDNSHDIPKSFSDEFAKLRLIQNESNIGFGAAVNQAIPSVDSEWILVINPDVRLKPDCLEHLVNAAVSHRSPLVGPRFYLDDNCQLRLPPATGGSLWFHAGQACADTYTLDAKIHTFYWQIRHDRFWKSTEPFFEPFLSGACLLINASWVRSMGNKLFDERFFLYFEDTDLCARALLEGVNPLCVPQAEAIHYYNQSPEPSRKKMRAMQTSWDLFSKKYYDNQAMYHPMPYIDHPKISHDFIEMGSIIAPPAFELDKKLNTLKGKFFFEVGTDPLFIPFAQACINGYRFEFPADAWKRLSPGTYYARARQEHFESVNLWKWTKN